MRSRLVFVLRFVVANFGPLLAFWVGNAVWGLVGGIASSLAFSALEIAVRLARREKLTSLFKFTAVLTVVFGAVDLYLKQSVLFKYEAVLTNVLVGGFFAASLARARSFVEEAYAAAPARAKPAPPALGPYLRVVTGAWAAYFFVKAGVYAYLAAHYELSRAMLLRSLIGTGSFVAMFAGERLVRRPLYALVARLVGAPAAAPAHEDPHDDVARSERGTDVSAPRASIHAAP